MSKAKEELERIIKDRIDKKDFLVGQFGVGQIAQAILDAGFVRKEDVELDEEKIRR